MDKQFKYSILKFRPSYLLDERVNVGLLFVFVEDQKVAFLYPKHLKRIKDLYPGVNLSHFRNYLNAFKHRANKIDIPLFIDSPTILEDEFLIEDANSFYFTDFKEGFYQSVQATLDYYQDQFFSVYERELPTKYNEGELRKDFKLKLKERLTDNAEKLSYFKSEGIYLNNKIDRTDFDFAWQNGSVNLIKAIGFDLVSKENIQRKSFRWYGELTKLKETSLSKNIRFDLLVAPPRNKSLFKSYSEALEILDSIESAHKIIEPNDFNDYIDIAANTVTQLTIALND